MRWPTPGRLVLSLGLGLALVLAFGLALGRLAGSICRLGLWGPLLGPLSLFDSPLPLPPLVAVVLATLS